MILKGVYGVHDEAKDKDFELELSWVCDESKRQHEKAALEEMDAD
uniref:Proteasome subunit alpha type n=1 Tax=Oryza punctata TaxID=4537 RepID=A0A0E0KQP4_ORYPU